MNNRLSYIRNNINKLLVQHTVKFMHQILIILFGIVYCVLKLLLERFLIYCRETKTKAITMANHSQRKQQNEPMRTRSKYT